MSVKVLVYHASYGCDTGCCGHIVQVGGEVYDGNGGSEGFRFDHPHGGDPLEFAKRLVREVLGPEHVADLDWENCVIADD